jgi:hypothetical protein
LDNIMTWARRRSDNNSDDRFVYWLNGIAGTGKTTIARTIAHTCAEEGILGASFFFSISDGGDRASARKFVTSVARQLANISPALKRSICAALRERRDIASQALHMQWRQLVLRPLVAAAREADGSAGSLSASAQSTLPRGACYVLVIDAVDECASEGDITGLLRLMAAPPADMRAARLRVFITSRPEVPVRCGFRDVGAQRLQHLILHEIEPAAIDRDIRTYFDSRLREIATECGTDAGWPGADAVNKLVEMAGGLFIWAATACRYIHAGSLVDKRLNDILEGHAVAAGPEQGLSRIYFTVLRNSVAGAAGDDEREEAYQRLRVVLGAVVTLLSPLSGLSLAQLLDKPEIVIDSTLRSLHSIVNIPEDRNGVIQLHHASFRDFLLNEDKCDDANFYVAETVMHRLQAARCLALMKEHLKRDMCDLRLPDSAAPTIDSPLLERCLPFAVRYACCFWAQHIQRAQCWEAFAEDIRDFFEEHFLHWLEAMCLMGKSSDSIELVADLESSLVATVRVSILLFSGQAY